jgi:hypothetical protein
VMAGRLDVVGPAIFEPLAGGIERPAPRCDSWQQRPPGNLD